MNTLPRHPALALSALILLAAPAAAQLVTDTVPRTRTVPIEQTVARQITEARYRLGPIRVQPTFLLRNLGYNDNVFGATDSDEAVDDWTATVGAGVEAWLPFGPKMVLASMLRPEYTWYKDNDELSRMGGYYDAAAYGFFNRLRLEARALTEDTQTIVSSELLATARRETRGFSGRAEVEILRRLSVFVGADRRSFEHETPDVEGLGYDVTRLDRDDAAMRAGVRYAWRSWFDVSAMVEKTETGFDTTPELRDNESEAVLVGVHYDRPQFFVNLVGGQREGTPANGSSFPEYSTWTGSYFMQYRLTAPIDVEVFGGRDVTYAVGANDPYFFETRNGGALRFQLGRRLSTRIFGETGTHDYTELPGNVREDDVTRVGASVSVPVWRTLALTVTAAQDDYDSNLPGFDRSVLRWGATVGLRNLIFR